MRRAHWAPGGGLRRDGCLLRSTSRECCVFRATKVSFVLYSSIGMSTAILSIEKTKQSCKPQCGLPRCLECHPRTAPLSASRHVAARSGLVVLAFNVKALCRGDYKTANLCWHFFLSGVVVQFTVCVLTTVWQCVRCADITKALASLAHSSTQLST